MTYSICPACGAMHSFERGDREPQKKPCRSCAVKGNLSRLAWTTPRRNNLGRAWR